ncbi:U-box domain-containing protein 45 [Nicotiana tabacum]|uniref:U-box domain-containing protein 45 n=1 Tax=Nicotiana tabacum TaxID=4097 RepID=A0A1S4CUW2_TOBAC|nr:U-box domain-containing protein 7 [Nicotiana tomentosiformis]XP_016504911.1 PREDICTED: U-box domain-containing protein 7-like [Nicotiana tabacum]
MPNTSTTSTTSNWYLTCIKLRFFTKVRRFLQLKAASKKPLKPSDQPRENSDTLIVIEEGEKGIMGKESDIKDNGWMVLQKSVKKLHFGSSEEKEVAAKEIKKLAKEDLKRRKLMAELGVIPPLVAMIGGSEVVVRRQRLAVQALVELSSGSFTNKALMVEAGILSRLPPKPDNLDGNTRQEFAELILSISSLANTQFNMDSSRIIPFVVSILDSSNSSVETKSTCLGTLYNLSSVLENAAILANNGTVTTLLRLSSLKEVSEKALATLGNLVVTLMGKKAMEENPMVPESLIEIMTWEEKPKCQELSVYILMILAHQSSIQREKMAKSGIVPVLLEVALLGSSLAQKRALKLLQWFKDERQSKMGPHSGPQVGRMAIDSPPVSPRAVDESKKLMKKIVKQSLHKNMETITSRANGASDCSRLKSLVVSSSSKSLPY